MITRCSLEEFVQKVRELHEGRLVNTATTTTKKKSVPSGGIKRTRLMLRLRPKDTRKTFVLKATDGLTTFITRVEHYGQIQIVERLLADFVTTCTSAAPAK